MRLPLGWLHDYVVAELEPRALAERLAMTGTEVDRLHHHGVGAVEHFVVGKVLTAVQHPDADRLRVCTVDVGSGEDQQIVCGAPNVAAGQTVAVARPGAVMPDGAQLGTAKLRGVASAGMILAEDELGIGLDHAGIMVLDETLAAGTPLDEVLPLSTEVLELEITPNRPDCLGVYGVAREVHAATGAPLAPPPWATDPGTTGPVADAQVVVEAPDLCPRFTARVFTGVQIGPSPPWLKARLMAAGQRPINTVVDITNYVTLLTGQPLHAFDLDRVAGGKLTVRRARAGETLTTLDDVERTLDQTMCLIEDAEGPTSVGGIMGGARSEVHAGTTRVLMEVATWHGPSVHATSAKLSLRTEASTRIEKGLSPEAAMEAQIVATQLMLELTGAQVVPGTIDERAAPQPAAVIRLREERVFRILGAPVARDRQAEILTALGFGVEQAGDGLDVTVPHHRRFDVTREADLIEEVARIDGVDRLPATLPTPARAGVLSHPQRGRRRAEDALVGHGLHEIAGWSFTDPGLPDRLRIPQDSPMRKLVVLENPMASDQSVMRPSILGSLLDAARHNRSRGMPDVALFESGGVYRALGGPLADEHHALGALLVGRPGLGGWGGDDRPADFFAAKGVLAAVLDGLRVPWTVQRGSEGFLHPGRAATVLVSGEKIGWVGEVHPLVAATWDIEEPVSAFAIDLGRISAEVPEVLLYQDLTSYPSLRQDIAVVLDADVEAAEVLRVVREAGAPELRAAQIFDVFTGAQLGEGRRSLAIHLEFRGDGRTLTDEDVAAPRARIVARLAKDLGGELRGG